MFLTTVRWRYADGLFLFKNTLKTYCHVVAFGCIL